MQALLLRIGIITNGRRILLLLSGATMIFITAAQAQADVYQTGWHIVSGGGTSSGGGLYTLAGSIDQRDDQLMGGGGYTLVGGFWPAAAWPALAGDLNGDGKVDLADISILGSYWLATNCSTPLSCHLADLDGDFSVSLQDLLILSRHWLDLAIWSTP
jgi:hypothetical protein